MERVPTSTATLIWLAALLPLLALLTAQFQIGCEGGCSLFRQIVGALWLPFAGAWLVVVAGLLGRAWQQRTASRVPKRQR